MMVKMNVVNEDNHDDDDGDIEDAKIVNHLEFHIAATPTAAGKKERQLCQNLQEGKFVHDGEQRQGVGADETGRGTGQEILQPFQVALPDPKDPAYGHQETI